MAEHSTLYILRKRTDAVEVPEKEYYDEKERIENRINENKMFSGDMINIPNYLYKSAYYQMFSLKDKMYYTILFEMGFGSTFTCIREEFGLNAYNNSEFEINYNMAKEMRQALNYLLNFKYSDKVEEIMDNQYITILGHNLPVYEYRKLSEEDKGGEDFFDIEGKFALKRLKTTLDTFIALCDEDTQVYTEEENKSYKFDYKLLYVCD